MSFLLFFKLIRWKNIFILLFCLLLFKYIVFPFFNTTSLLTSIEFTALLISTSFITAGGYVINDCFDQRCDAINKPEKTFIPTEISVKKAKNVYWLLSLTGVTIGCWLSFQRNMPYHSMLFISTASLLYFYSSYLKKIALIGNVTIAFLVAFSLLVFAIFDTDLSEKSEGLYYIWVYAFFSFCINLLREIIKDIEDLKGDHNAGMKTLPILLGTERTKKLILLISTIPLYFSIQFLQFDLKNNFWAQLYFTMTIVLPLFYFCYKTHNNTTNKQFHQLSTLLKWMLVFGLILLFLITNDYA